MLLKVPNLEKVILSGGKLAFRVIASKETAHIQQMVKLQRPSKKKPRRAVSYYYLFTYSKMHPSQLTILKFLF